MMKQKGSITITRPHGSGPDYISIKIEDEVSGIRFLDIEMNPHDFAMAITGLGYMPCDMEIRGIDLIGKIREVKTETVFINHKGMGSRQDREEAAKMSVAKMEKDGWKGRWEDALNHHHIGEYTDQGYYASVSFVRFVDATNAGDEE